MPSKHIVFVNSVGVDRLGGGEQWNIRIMNALLADGHRVSLICRPESKLIDAASSNIDVLERNFGFDFNPISIQKIYAWLGQHPADAMICNFTKDVSIAGVAARLKKVPRIIFRNGFPILHDKFKHRMLLPFFDDILTNSSQIIDQYAAYQLPLENRMHLIHNGIPVAQQQPPYREAGNPFQIIGAGRLTQVKRFDRFIRIIDALHQQGLSIRATIFGEGPRLAELQALIDQLNAPVILAGYTNSIAAEIEAADAVLHTSSNEGLPNIAMEGMYFAKPVVCAISGGIRDLIINGENGYLVDGDDEMTAVEHLKRLISDTEHHQHISLAGQKTVYDRFTFEQSYRKCGELLGIGH